MHIQHLTPAAMHLLSLFIWPRPVYRKNKKNKKKKRSETTTRRTLEPGWRLKHLHGSKNKNKKTAASANIDPFIKALKPAATPTPHPPAPPPRWPRRRIAPYIKAPEAKGSGRVYKWFSESF